MIKPRGIIKFQKQHWGLVSEWYRLRDLPMPKRTMHPAMGFIVDGRVAGWLYLTDSDIAMIEGVVADPLSVPSLRRQSTDKLIGYLIDTAMMLGYSTILGISKHSRMLDLTKRYGFKELKDYKVVVLDTTEYLG